MNYLARAALFLCASIVLIAPSDATAARKAKDLLKYIPADTPYVLATTEPAPDALQEHFEPAMDAVFSAYQRILRMHLAEELARLSTEEGGEKEAAKLEAFAEEVLSLMSVKALREAGLGRDSLFAFYGDGVLPVVRLALTDIDAFRATIERLEEKSGERFATGEVEGQSYRYRDFQQFRLVISTAGKDAVLTVVPTSYSDKRLASALGVRAPKRNLAKSKELRAIAREYDFTDHILGFVNFERLVATFTGDPSGANAELLAIMGYDAASITPQCRAEFTAMAEIAPRMVIGYTEFSSEVLDSEFIFELREDIAAGMATLPAAVPGLGADPGGLFSFGFSMDPMALRKFVEARLDAIEADPYKCEALAQVQAGTAEARLALQKPIPPMVYNFRGMLGSLTDINWLDFSSEQPPEAIDGGAVLAMASIETLVSTAAMMSPEVAAINLLPDGKARLLEVPQLAEIADEAYAALSAGALALGFGVGGDELAETMLAADASATQTFFSMSVDAGRYYEFLGEAFMKGETEEGEEPMPIEMREAFRDAMIASVGLYDRMTVDVLFTERGIEMGNRITVAK